MQKIVKFFQTYQLELAVSAIIIALTVTSFNLGRISALRSVHQPLTLGYPSEQGSSQSPAPLASFVVASKTSKTKYYHLPWCAGAKQISDKNKITFATEQAAVAAGYTLAGNCKRQPY